MNNLELLCKNEEKAERACIFHFLLICLLRILVRRASLDWLQTGEELVGEQRHLVKDYLIERNY